MGKPGASNQERRKKNELRTEIRQKCKAGLGLNTSESFVLKSCQTCGVNDNLSILEGHIKSIKSSNRAVSSDEISSHLCHLMGLKAVWQMLLATVTCPGTGNQSRISFMHLDEAYSLFRGYNRDGMYGDFNTKNAKKRFKELLVHPKYGLSVYVIGDKFIVLKSNEADLESFFEAAFHEKSLELERFLVDCTFVQELMQCVDSEWDKKIIRALIAVNKSRKEVQKLGMDSDRVIKNIDEVKEAIKDRTRASQQAEEIVRERLYKQLKSAQVKIKAHEKTHCLKAGRWTKPQLDDIQEDMQVLKEHVGKLESVISCDSKSSKIKFKSMIRREQKKLVTKNRIGMRNLGAGRHVSLDEEDENFLLQCIDSKSTAHGRRHDAVMYLHHRVKKRDLLKIANFNRVRRGLPVIRSATTVSNRGRAKNKRSKQARNHIGKGLFCTKKPPKAESNDNELTHHQRAHRKNIQRFMWGEENVDGHEYTVEISEDDKAYICPGTSAGMASARNQTVIQPTNEDHARKLTKYDFPTSMVNVTPATHRFMTKSIKSLNGKDEICIDEDDTIVYVRPKHFVGSSGSVWASEAMRIRYENPYLYDVAKLQGKNSKAFNSFLIHIKDKLVHYIDSTEKEDVMLISRNTDSCIYRQYEKERLSSLVYHVKSAADSVAHDTNILKQSEQVNIVQYLDDAKVIVSQAENTMNALISQQDNMMIWSEIDQLLTIIAKLVGRVSLSLPALKSRILEFTDGGPGVAVSNKDVTFRTAERIRITDTDWLTRCHLANNDSSLNDVERCQSYVGDAVCDGGCITWEYRKAFEDLTAEQIKGMSHEELEMEELKRMEYNAFKVSEEIALRIDGAVAPGGYMKSYVSSNVKELFFVDTEYLHQFLNSSAEKRKLCPGTHYFQKIENFIENHVNKGAKYYEYIKHSCREKNGQLCSYCEEHPWIGPECRAAPRPFPNIEVLPKFQYLHVSRTPTHDNGILRPADDYQPREQLKRAFKEKTVSLGSSESVRKFSRKFIVEERYVRDAMERMQAAEIRKDKKAQSKRTESAREIELKYNEIDWKELFETGGLRKKTVKFLDKYLIANDMVTALKFKKKQKLNVIIQHLSTLMLENYGDTINKPAEPTRHTQPHDFENVSDLESDSVSNDSDYDEVIDETVHSEENETSSESDNFDYGELFHTTRSGRVCGGPNLHKYR